MLSSALLAGSVLVVVMMLIFTHTTGCRYYTDHHAAYAKWYQWARWPVMWCFAMMMGGTVYGCFAFKGLIQIKFVDLSIETHPGVRRRQL